MVSDAVIQVGQFCFSLPALEVADKLVQRRFIQLDQDISQSIALGASCAKI